MIEVLVSAVILSIGLLGVAAMQIAGLRYSQGAYQSSQATVAVADLADRMRANPDLDAASGEYEFDLDDASPEDACVNSACTATQLARHDVREWREQVLPGFGATAASVERNGDVFTISVTWRENAERNDDGDPVERSLSTEVRL